MRAHLVIMALLTACSGSSPPPEKNPSPTGSGGPTLQYMSDCSLTNPIAVDPCSGTAASTRGLTSCAQAGVKLGDSCGSNAASCYLETTCTDGRTAVSDYLVCVDKSPDRCLTRSSAQFKQDIRYLSPADVQAVAREVETLRLARFRYSDQNGGEPRLGFITEDASGTSFVSPDGRTVDLYSLLSASVAALQQQDARIKALEERVSRCR
ncbi:MAG: tail fiber domain-containing protein [Deltaproteobacteria bacterium]|nr:tail fiber domain-containing protein [Deltaproteobacteria bacterium]